MAAATVILTTPHTVAASNPSASLKLNDEVVEQIMREMVFLEHIRDKHDPMNSRHHHGFSGHESTPNG